MKCPSCGKTINGDSLFCSYCGMPIKDDYKTRQQILRNKKEEQRRRSQEAADAMWSEVEPRNKMQKPAQPKTNYSAGAGRNNSSAGSSRAKMSVLLVCPKCHTKYNMFVQKGIYFSLKTTCPCCQKKWKKHYWGPIFIFVILIILLYMLATWYFPGLGVFVKEWIKNILRALIGA